MGPLGKLAQDLALRHFPGLVFGDAREAEEWSGGWGKEMDPVVRM